MAQTVVRKLTGKPPQEDIGESCGINRDIPFRVPLARTVVACPPDDAVIAA